MNTISAEEVLNHVEFFSSVYNVLVWYAWAPADLDNYHRFRLAFKPLQMNKCNEYRFQGSLGFGGNSAAQTSEYGSPVIKKMKLLNDSKQLKL